MPIASPSTTRATIRLCGDQAAPLSIDPTTNRMAARTSERLRPSVADIQPAPAAPMAAPNIIELTIHSMV